ncbi:NB-ARC domain-containing protein [Gossypium australe]|uniref:NB-ARC domain-containing protein n=1 Tax=Gossypium australe TaxID=47621 RepID=A0A5B6VRQ4_9ROSI|nr:NB-ARC domain-containing protein [Gossypium australe]
MQVQKRGRFSVMKGKSASLGDAVVAPSLMEQTSSRSLDLWLSDLRGVAYDAEDIIDELTTEARRRQITEDPDAASPTCKVGRYFSACFLRLNPSTAKFSTKMEFRLESYC